MGRPQVAGLPETLRDVDRCLVMGVVNVTPDSFSDGGQWFEPAEGVRHGRDLLAQGADLLDVGGESTRPGAHRPGVAEELRRVIPVVRGLVAAGALVSIDTMTAEVARAALDEGAVIVNDVSGGLADPAMAGVVAAAGVPFVVMHWRGHSERMDDLAVYDDVVTDVRSELTDRVAALAEQGVDPAQVVVDPGFGFAKTAEHNLRLLDRLDVLVGAGRPVLVGTSRKRFLGTVLADEAGVARPALGRDAGTAATSALAAAAGAWCVRVHEVASTVDAVRVVAAMRGVHGAR